jgi:hypothetical protein
MASLATSDQMIPKHLFNVQELWRKRRRTHSLGGDLDRNCPVERQQLRMGMGPKEMGVSR